MEQMDIGEEGEIKKFIGHVLLLYDANCIETNVENCGVKYRDDEYDLSVAAEYRITSIGYEYLSIIKKETILNRIKGYSIGIAIEMGKKIVLDQVMGLLK